MLTLVGGSLGGLLALMAQRVVSAQSTSGSAAPTTKAAPSHAPAVRQDTGDRPLRLLFWQAPTILNPHLGRGPSDYAAARCCLEPLLSAENDGHLTPILAAEVPTAENGGLPDDRTVIYRLRPGIVWADGQPFTAHDVVFTFQFITQPESAATALLAYRLV